MSHVFISYVHEDSTKVHALADTLRSSGASVWLDRDALEPGVFWKDAISNAIRSGSYFIACFSSAYHERSKSYMNEELNLAIEELRRHPAHRKWFIPVRLEDVEIPNWPIRAGLSLQDIQAVQLGDSDDTGVARLLRSLDLEDPLRQREATLLGLAESKFPAERTYAFAELRKHVRLSQRAIDLLTSRLDDPSGRRDAAAYIYHCAATNIDRVAVASRLLKDPDSAIRREAFAAMLKHAPESDAFVLDTLSDPSPAMRLLVVENLKLFANSDRAQIEALILALKDPDASVRKYASTRAMRSKLNHVWGELGTQVIAALAAAIVHEPESWETFLQFVTRNGPPPEEAMIAIEAILNARNLALQQQAANLLATSVSAEQRLVRTLRRDQDPHARVGAAYALGQQPRGPDVLATLAHHARFDGDIDVALAAASALRRLAGGSTRSHLREAPVLQATTYPTWRREIPVRNPFGLDAGPAAKLVKTAARFNADITVSRDGNIVDVKSIMGLMMLALGQGTVAIVTAAGPEALEALDAIEDLFDDGFSH